MGEAADTRKMNGRIVCVDRVRAVALVLALFSHAMIATGGWWTVAIGSPRWAELLQFVARTSTLTFVLLLGASAEIVYVQRWGRDGGRAARRRLMQRAAQCWLGVLVVAAAAVVGGMASLEDLVLGMFAAGPVRFANIFALYALLLPILVAVIPLRIRWGLGPTFVATLGLWVIPISLRTVGVDFGSWAFFTSRTLGVGGLYGPSVLHSLAVVAAGMVVGRVLIEMSDGELRVATRRVALGVFGFALVGAVAMIPGRGVVGLITEQGHPQALRGQSHPGYYAVGLLAALMVLAVGWAVSRRGPLARMKPGPFASSSLLAFALGNAALNLWGARWVPLEPVAVCLWCLALVTALWCGMSLVRRARERNTLTSVSGVHDTAEHRLAPAGRS